jgi:predicted DNA-binding protein YlxM (UPF0122 family)
MAEEAKIIVSNLEKIIDHLQQIYELVVDICDLKFSKLFKKVAINTRTPPEIFNTYYQIVIMITVIDDTLDQLKAVDLVRLEKSESYKDDVRDRLKHAEIALTAVERLPFKEMLAKFTEAIYRDKTNILEVQKLFHRYPETIQLYASILQKYADTGNIEQVHSILNADKDFVLKSESTAEFKNPTIHLDNPPYKRFNLIPVTDLMPLNELLPICLMEINQRGTDLEAIATRANVGFIMMTHVVYNPIEYNVRALIIEKLAKQYEQPAAAGVTKKMTAKFHTIREYPAAKWNFSYKIINHGARAYYVLETLDGTKYRALHLTYNVTRYLIPVASIHSLIDYIQSDNKPSRITNYQAAVSKMAIKNMFLPKQLDLESFEEKTSLVSPDKIRLAIYTECRLYINEHPPTDLSELNDLLHNDAFAKIFYNNVISMFNDSVNIRDLREGYAGTFDFSEIYVSFLYDLRYVTNKFMKELHDGVSRGKPSDDLAELALKIIDASLLLTITDKSDLYSAVHLKYMILNF